MSKQHLLHPAGMSPGLILLLGLLTALDVMAIDMYLPGMPQIASDFNASPGRVQQTLAVFLAGLAVGQGLYGPFLDRYGRRLPLLVGICIFVLGSVLGAVAPSMEWLLVARFIQSVGAAAGVVTPRAIVADLCDLKESARIFSLLVQVMMIAPIVAPIAGGYLLDYGSWRVIFWVLAVLGVGSLVWAMRGIPESLPVASRAPLEMGHVVRSYCRQLRNPAYMAYTLSGGFILGGLFVYISGSAFVFTEHFGLTPAQFSYVFAANSVGLMLGGAASNGLLRVGVSPARILQIGLVLHALAALLLYVVARAGTPALMPYAGLLALAIGALGLVFGNLMALTMNNAGPHAGAGSALMGMLHYLMSALVGYVVSLAAQTLGLLPLSVAVCGLLSLGCYGLARRAERSLAH